MKSLIYFVFVIFFSTLTTIYITKKELKTPHDYSFKEQSNYEEQNLKLQTKHLLSKFIYQQKIIKMNNEMTKENLNFIKKKTNPKNKKK